MEGSTVSCGAARGATGATAAAEAESRRAAVGQGWQRPWGKAVSSCVMRAQHSAAGTASPAALAQMSCQQQGRGSGRLGSLAQGSAAEAASSHQAPLLATQLRSPQAALCQLQYPGDSRQPLLSQGQRAQ